MTNLYYLTLNGINQSIFVDSILNSQQLNLLKNLENLLVFFRITEEN